MLGFDENEVKFFDLDKRYFIPYFSYSQLNTFLTCPESFRRTYLSGKFESVGNKYTALGSILHDIFEKQGKQLISDGNPLTRGQAVKQFNRDFLKLKDTNAEYFTDKDDFISMYKRGIRAIENYFEMYGDSAPLFVEKKFLGKVAEGLPLAKSFIDRIDGEDPEDASTWILSDYKTGSSPKSKNYLRTDFQMGLYVAQVFAQYGAYPKAVQFVHPVPQKVQTAIHQGNGVYKFKGQRAPVVEFSVSDVLLLIRNTIADIVEAKERGEFPLKPDSWSCKMCPFYQSGECQPFDKQQQGWASI
jgi:CRISPR/Cas system-associated exonuclease Cas4 (RecB family)